MENTTNTISTDTIIERKMYILEVNKTNKNFRKYTDEVVNSWIENIDDSGYDVEFAIGMKPSDIQYEFINSELVCGVLTKLTIEDGVLYGTVKFSTEGFKSKEIYSGEINLDDCVVVPKGKSEVRDGIVQKNYILYGFVLLVKSQSAFYFE